jgi:hypothetical protein
MSNDGSIDFVVSPNERGTVECTHLVILGPTQGLQSVRDSG